MTDSGPKHVAIVAGFNSVGRLAPSRMFGGLECTRNVHRDHFADHRRALRNANILLSSAPRNSGNGPGQLHHLAPLEFVLRDEGEAGSAAGFHQLAGAVGLHPDVAGFFNGRL